jgi:hypothetical protein
MKIIIQIEDDKIRLQVPDFNFEQTEKNTALVEPAQNKIMALGENDEKLFEILKIDEKAKDFKIYRPFTSKDFGPDLALDILHTFIRYLESKCFKGLWIIPILLFNPVDVSFEFPDYDLVDSKLRELFEGKLRWKLKVRSFLLNGKPIQTRLTLLQATLRMAGIWLQ